MIAPLYRLVVALRNRWYDRAGRTIRVDVPVVSVGNLTVGGTGKTPMAVLVVNAMIAWGYRPAILTRGYMPDGSSPSDEVQEMQQRLPGVPIVVNRDRVAGARHAISQGADALVLDDGFQHRRLGRCFDLVLVDATNPFAGGVVAPWRMREPIEGLRRASGVVITRCNQAKVGEVERIEQAVRAQCTGPVVQSRVEPTGLLDGTGSAVAPAGQRVLVACAVGNPESVMATAEGLGLVVAGCVTWRDHHLYGPADLLRMVRRSGELQADAVITTAKDWVKLAGLLSSSGGRLANGLPVWTMPVQHVIIGGDDLLAAIRAACYTVRPPADKEPVA